MSTTLIHPEWVQMELCDMGKSIFNELPLSQDRYDLKKASIETSLLLGDYQLLKNLTLTRDGLLSLELRRKVWPLLLSGGGDGDGHNESSINSCFENIHHDSSFEQLPIHKDEDQLRLDIDRSFINYPNISSSSSSIITSLREKLTRLITRLLRTHPDLNYYQGFHDVASVILLVFCSNSKTTIDEKNLEEETAYRMLEALTLYHLRDFMLPMIDYSIDHLKLIPQLLKQIDPSFGVLISELPPFYSLSSIITMYLHNLKSFEDVCLIWDFILSENSMMFSIYFYVAALIFYKKDIYQELFEISGYSELDFSNDDNGIVIIAENKDFIHSILSNFLDKNVQQSEKSNFYEILQLTMGYLHKFPPSSSSSSSSSLSVESMMPIFENLISENSVLRNTSAYVENMNLEDVRERTNFYNTTRISNLFQLQLQDSKLRLERKLIELQRIKLEEEEEELQKIEKQKKQLLMLLQQKNSLKRSITEFLSFTTKNNNNHNHNFSDDNKISKNKKRGNISSIIFKYSFAVGILSLVLKRYCDSQGVDLTTFVVLGLHNLKNCNIGGWNLFNGVGLGNFKFNR